MVKRKSAKLSDQVRLAIDESGMSRYAIAKIAAIDESLLAKFYNKKGGLSTPALDRLGEALGLEVVAAKKPKGK
jgi:hypothetical protein